HYTLIIYCCTFSLTFYPPPPQSTLFPYTTLFRSATMELLGDRNWWLPRWLDRILPSVNIEGTLEHTNPGEDDDAEDDPTVPSSEDRKSTRLNSSHVKISYAVFCLKKKNRNIRRRS